jgi:hypothetical protein
MPAAVAIQTETIRHDLKSLDGGFVELRRMTYGQIVQRRALTKLSVLSGKGVSKNVTGEMAMASKEVTQFEFDHCIVAHNLEDVDGRPLVLSGPDFDKLDPRVGTEIERYISDMNNFDEDDLGN